MELKTGKVLLEYKGSVGIITISNENAMNAMTLEMVYDLVNAVKILDKNPKIRCGIITGSGNKSFTSGGDLKAEVKYANEEHDKIDLFNRIGIELISTIMNSSIPFIAAVNGYALGAALALVLACDLLFASKNSVFGMPTPSLGGIPGWGCTQFMSRISGRQNAQLMLMLNEKVNADEAFRLGIVNKLFDPEDLIEQTLLNAQKIASYAPNTMQALKKLVNKGLELDINSAIELEAETLYHINTQQNFVEGINSFIKKQIPKYDMKKTNYDRKGDLFYE